jgi:hypothetical protein
MIRAMAVIVVAALCAALFGVDGAALAAQGTASQQQAIAARVARLKIGDIVRIEQVDGTKLEGVLADKMADRVTIDLYRRRAFRRPQRVGSASVLLADMKEIKRPLTRTETTLIISGVAVGACAIAGAIAANTEQQQGERPSSTPTKPSDRSHEVDRDNSSGSNP